jgi:hypothetical protein
MLLTVFCPPAETGVFETMNVTNGVPTAVTYAPRLFNGRFVIDIPKELFQQILMGNNGKKWLDENWEAVEWLGRDHVMENGDAFPGRDRPAPTAPVATTEIEPKIVKLRAPEGTTSFSFEGVEHKIGKNHTIEVLDHVADVLRSHGFLPA